MLGRCVALTILWVLVDPGAAHAHRLEAGFKVRPDQRLQVEAWFDLTGEPAREARVQVFREENRLLFEGRLNNDGILVVSYEKAEPLRVVVSAGAGHVKELRISAEELAKGLLGEVPGSPRIPDAPTSLLDRSSKISMWNVLLGVGLCLGVAGAAVLVRWARERRETQSNTSSDRKF